MSLYPLSCLFDILSSIIQSTCWAQPFDMMLLQVSCPCLRWRESQAVSTFWTFINTMLCPWHGATWRCSYPMPHWKALLAATRWSFEKTKVGIAWFGISMMWHWDVVTMANCLLKPNCRYKERARKSQPSCILWRRGWRKHFPSSVFVCTVSETTLRTVC